MDGDQAASDRSRVNLCIAGQQRPPCIQGFMVLFRLGECSGAVLEEDRHTLPRVEGRQICCGGRSVRGV